MQQSQDLARARQAIENMLHGKVEQVVMKDSKPHSERSRPSPTKSKMDLKAHFSEPPAPPPQAPLPEKPDVARALADPIIQPLLRRTDTARPMSASNSPTRSDHSGDILRLCEELKLAKGELSNQSERMKNLEHELAQERTARESAEERAQRLEQGERRDSPTGNGHPSAGNSPQSRDGEPAPELQVQLDRLHASMDEMKTQMEAHRQRAELAEVERDEARSTLAEMVEQKRKDNADGANATLRSPSTPPRLRSQRPSNLDGTPSESNGHAVPPASVSSSPTSGSLLERAGVEDGQPITQEQAKIITQFLAQEVLGSDSKLGRDGDHALMYYGVPYGSFAAVVVLGYIAMTWVNAWPKVER